MIIRKATEKDLIEISDIFRVESSKKPYLQKWTRKTSLEKMNGDYKENDFFVVSIDKKIVGFMIASIQLTNKTKAYIDELWIRSHYQGRGFGRALMAEIEKEYRRKGVRLIRIVSNRRTGAYIFYKKLNYLDSKELVFMEKTLR